MKKGTINSFFKRNWLLIMTCFLTVGCGVVFGIKQYEYSKHFINPTVTEMYDVKKENTYVVLEKTSYVDSNEFVRNLRKLNREKGIGYYIVDLTTYSKTQLAQLNVSTEYIQYRVFATNYTAESDGRVTESRYLLYTGAGNKKWNQLGAEINFVKKYGKGDTPYYLQGTTNLCMCFAPIEKVYETDETVQYAITFYAYTLNVSETVSSNYFKAYVNEDKETSYTPLESFSETIAYTGSEYAVTVVPKFTVPKNTECLTVQYESSYSGETFSFKIDVAIEECCS